MTIVRKILDLNLDKLVWPPSPLPLTIVVKVTKTNIYHAKQYTAANMVAVAMILLYKSARIMPDYRQFWTYLNVC